MAHHHIIIDKTVDEEAARLLAAYGMVEHIDATRLDSGMLKNADVLVIRTNTIIDKELLENAPRLGIVATATTGTNHIDKEAAGERGVAVIDAKGANADSVADYVFRMLLVATDDAHYANVLLKARPGEFSRIKKENRRRELGSLSMGIIGLGSIGSRVARRARAFGMEVRAYDPYVIEAIDTLDEVLRCDVVTIHAELTDETSGMIGERELGALKEDVVFINAARGEIVDEEALARKLTENEGMIAIVDVFAREPAPSPLYGLANCIVTPHIAGNALEAKRRAGRMVAEKVIEELLRRKEETALAVMTRVVA